MCRFSLYFSYFLLTVCDGQRKLRRAGPATSLLRYGATLTPHSHGGPEVSGGGQGDLAAAQGRLRPERRFYVLSETSVGAVCGARPVLPWSIIQVAGLHISLGCVKSLKMTREARGRILGVEIRESRHLWEKPSVCLKMLGSI